MSYTLRTRGAKPYLAGFVDGEGAIFFTRKFKNGRFTDYRLRLTVTNTDRQALELYADRYGGSVVRVPKKPPRKDCYYWVVEAQKAIDVLTDLMSHLLVKRELAVIAIAFQHELWVAQAKARATRKATRDKNGRFFTGTGRTSETAVAGLRAVYDRIEAAMPRRKGYGFGFDEQARHRHSRKRWKRRAPELRCEVVR